MLNKVQTRRRLIITLIFSVSLLLNSNYVNAEGAPQSTQYWWPDKLSLEPLRQHNPASNPFGKNFNYIQASSCGHFSNLRRR